MLDSWDYEEHKNRQLVTKACHDLQVRVAKDLEEIKKVKQDTRAFHLEMFNSVTPADKTAFAGNYRGSEFQYLKNYNVSIGNHQGTLASQVAETMHDFHLLFVKSLKQFNQKSLELSKETKLVVYSRLISHFVVAFLSIHPYANGNGHISRLIAWALFCYKGFNIQNWDLDKRPDQPFDSFIAMYQQGHQDAMAYYFMQLLALEN